MDTQKLICRFCLKICDTFKALEENMKDFLDKLLPKINLAAIQKAVVCSQCQKIVKKCFDFKVMCFNTRDDIIPFSKKDAVKLSLRNVPLSRNEDITGQDICGFCRSPFKGCSAVTPRVEREEITLVKMIEQCLPELDLSTIKKPVICAPCHGSLEMCFRFITNCLIVEDKIKKYCETFEVFSTDQVELSNLLQFAIRDVTKIEADGNSVGIIKLEEQFCEDRENADEGEIGKGCDIFKSEQMSWDVSENDGEEIEHKNNSYVDINDLKFNNEKQCSPNNMLVCEIQSNNLDIIKMEETFCEENKLKEENTVETVDQKCLPNEEVEIKTEEFDVCRFETGVVSLGPEVITRLHSKLKCVMSTLKGDTKHTTKKHASKVIPYQCECCPFQTRSKSYLKNHLLEHKNGVTWYQCDTCLYQTKYKDNLKIHLLIHKDPSEVTMHKCEFCSFQSKYKATLNYHLLLHKDSSEVTMHKCDFCSFQTKYKGCLKKHLLKHKNPTEVPMYNCASCSFQTKHKYNLKDHLQKHKDPSEVTMYKCDSCSFESKYEISLKQHLLVHKNPSEVTMYTCGFCPFQTKYKSSLKQHSSMHKNPSEVTMYECDLCSFQTKHKYDLKDHLRKHKVSSEVAEYKCDDCSCQTKHEVKVDQYLLVQKDASEATMYKCDFCSFHSRRKGCLKKHSLLHKDPLEITKYKYNSCSF